MTGNSGQGTVEGRFRRHPPGPRCGQSHSKGSSPSAPAAVIVLDATIGKMILAETGDWDWPRYWDAL